MDTKLGKSWYSALGKERHIWSLKYCLCQLMSQRSSQHIRVVCGTRCCINLVQHDLSKCFRSPAQASAVGPQLGQWQRPQQKRNKALPGRPPMDQPAKPWWGHCLEAFLSQHATYWPYGTSTTQSRIQRVADPRNLFACQEKLLPDDHVTFIFAAVPRFRRLLWRARWCKCVWYTDTFCPRTFKRNLVSVDCTYCQTFSKRLSAASF